MDQLSRLEQNSVYILREAYCTFKKLCMLWSIGKDSTVLLWLARKAFLGHVPFPLVHIDTTYKIPEMIAYRDRLAAEWHLDIRYACNEQAVAEKQTFPHGTVDRRTCCKLLKTTPLTDMLAGRGKRYRFNHSSGVYDEDTSTDVFEGVLVGLRADEEATRSKERYFSPRDSENLWDMGEQPPEFWNQFNTQFPPGTHVRIHPLLDWTELTIWEYIEREKIPTVSLYYDSGTGTRYRSLGCANCSFPIQSTSKNPKEIIQELRQGQLVKIGERSGRAQDAEDGGTLETLRKEGYM